LFFVCLLFQSEEECFIERFLRTVVTEDEVVKELRKWKDAGVLKFAGSDKDRPAHRVMKMWREFVQQIEQESKLRGLFKRVRQKDMNRVALYTLSLRPIQTQITAVSIPSLLKRVAAR